MILGLGAGVNEEEKVGKEMLVVVWGWSNTYSAGKVSSLHTADPG